MEVGRDEKLEQLERILQSRAIEGSENLKSFLKYVVLKSIDESEDNLKEYTIATEVFGRSHDFSPRSDSVVRVQASRLRRKLKDYYATEGKWDKVLIDLPKGHYHPVFSFINGKEKPRTAEKPHQESPHPLAVESTADETHEKVRKDKKWIAVLGAVIALLVVLAAFLFMWNRNLHQQILDSRSQNKIEQFGPVWEPFLVNSDRTLLVLSNPTVYRFTNPMDTEVLLRKSVTLSPEQIDHINKTVGDKFMLKHGPGQIVLSTDEYTGMGEAIGLARIMDVFRSAGRTPLLKQSRTVSPEDLKNNNVILLGSVWVNEWSGKLPIKEDFVYTTDATIKNNNPQAGEESEYSPKFDGEGKLIEDYGLITVRPNLSYRNTVMVVAGIHSEGTEAAAEYFTSLDYLKNLNEHLRQAGGASGPPRYYQAILKVAVDNGIPTTISLLSVHKLQAPSQ